MSPARKSRALLLLVNLQVFEVLSQGVIPVQVSETIKKAAQLMKVSFAIKEITPADAITEAARILEDNQISRLRVAEGMKAGGMVSLSDLVTNIENTHLKVELID